ncbi:MAG: YafY family protein [Flavobacteriales bacterium]
MNRIERISAVLIMLQTKRVVRGSDIAERFNISLRTAYRDIRALEESGVPIIGEAGEGYSLMEGYRLPPIMFTQEEAQSFVTAEKLVAQLTDEKTSASYKTALEKIKAVLRSDDKDHVDAISQSIEVIQSPYLPMYIDGGLHTEHILKCVSQQLTLLMEYHTQYRDAKSHREVEPLGIFFMGSKWYMIAWCHTRKDYRNFRLDRIISSQITSNHFQVKHPTLKAYLRDFTREKRDMHTVVMRVQKEHMHCLGDQKYYNGFVSQKELEDTFEMTFLTSSLEGFVKWYLMIGLYADIVSPKVLRNMIADELDFLRGKFF